MATETQTTRTEHPHVVMTPGYCGGRPRIDGTRISIESVVKHVRAGESPEGIVEMFPHLALASVYDAIAYYYDHKDEIDAAIIDNSLEKAIERGEIEVDDKGVVTFKKPPRDR